MKRLEKHYKLYKNGKLWCCMAITSLVMVMSGFQIAKADTTNVDADGIPANDQTQLVAKASASESSAATNQLDSNKVAQEEVNQSRNFSDVDENKTSNKQINTAVLSSSSPLSNEKTNVITTKNRWVDENGQKVYYQNGKTEAGQDYVYVESMTDPNSKNWYMLKDGVAQSGLQLWYGTYYYFDPVTYLKVTDQCVPVTWANGDVTPYIFDNTGAIVRGLYEAPNGDKYYCDPSTYLRVTNEIVNLPNGDSMIFGEDGKALSGMQRFNGSLYYLNPDTNAMVKNNYVTVNGDPHGYMFGSNGKAQTGLQKWYGTYYYFDTSTYRLVMNKYIPVTWSNGNVTWYRFGPTGSIYTGLYKDGSDIYYFDPSTYLMVKNDFRIAEDNQGYMFGSNGKAVSGLQKWYGTYYYFDPTTYQMVRNQYLPVTWANGDVTWYMFDNTGAIVTGPYKWYGSLYYFSPITYEKVTDTWINNVYFNYTGSGIDHTNEKLQRIWASIINGQPGHIGIAIHSQFTGQTYSYTNAPGYRWITASTVKVAVLSELLHRTGGNLDGTMQSLATRMIRYSDNNATTAICNNYLGGVQGISNLYRALGMNSTGTTSTWGSTLTTPEDQLKLLDTIYLSDSTSYLSNESKDYIKYQMHNVSSGQNWGISAGSNDFYVKNGWIPYGYMYINSIGYIPGNNWSGYTIAIYTDGQSTFGSAINVIERLARETKKVMQG